MTGGKKARHVGGSRQPKGFLVFLVLVAGLVLVTLFAGRWVNQVLSDSSDSVTPPTPDGSASTVAPDGGTETDATGPGGTDDGPGRAVDLVEQCAAEVANVEVAVDAARRGVDHWSAHVQARTDMLRGRISVEKMEAIYARTKRQGPADHQRFSAAVSHIEHQVACQKMKGRPAGSTGIQSRDCLARSKTATAALAAAKSTMDEWLTHLHHMEQYADGGMRTGKALKLWIQAWRNAPEGISAYHARLADLAAAPPCSAG